MAVSMAPNAIYFQILLVLMAALTLRVCISMRGYSGQGQPPMYGDFEAQRHWMEITVNLPVREWYVQGPDNDLQYWGLDYPPATAYHMMLNGLVAQHVNGSMVALKQSRGLEDPGIKLFMRASGQGQPPMYGDFEAQRHWMEITVNLPVREWYVQGPDNDLQYWGLDYPPATAYHMMLNGLVSCDGCTVIFTSCGRFLPSSTVKD